MFDKAKGKLKPKGKQEEETTLVANGDVMVLFECISAVQAILVKRPIERLIPVHLTI